MDPLTIKYFRMATRRMLGAQKAFWRLLSVVGIFWLIGMLVSNFLATPVLTAAMPSGFAKLLSEAGGSGTLNQETLNEVTREISALRLLPALLFVTFLNLAISGAYNFAMVKVSLNVTDNPGASGREALSGILGGLRAPFSSAWLSFRIFAQIYLWSLLFVIPGIVAFYRYRYAWRIYADHPDYSVGKCISLSKTMTKGNKKALFRVDCGYWREILIVVFLALVAYGGTILTFFNPKLDTPFMMVASATAVILLFPAFLWMNFSIKLAQTILYRTLSPNPDSVLAAKESDTEGKSGEVGTSGVKSLLLAIGFSFLACFATQAAQPGKPSGASVDLPAREWAMVRQLAVNYDLSEEQTWLLAAIRRHENGRAGLEFGIGGPMNSGHPAHRYRDGYKSFYIQGSWAAGTVKRHFTGDFDHFGRRYCPVAPGTWATRVRYLVRKLKAENGGRLPGIRPPKRKIDFP